MQNKIILDIHTPTLASGHAYGTIREMAYAASSRELKGIGFTEHAPGIPNTCDPFYFCNLIVIPREIFGVKIFHGSEINVLNDGTLSLEEKWIEKLDYCIVGIHTQCYNDEGVGKNTQNAISCMKHPKVHFMSHPDDDHTPLDYNLLVLAAKQHKVALEVNNSSLVKKHKRLNCYENYKKMLKLCMELRVPIFVGSDAHDPSGVGAFKLAEELLTSLNFDEDLIINNSLEKFIEFINFDAAQLNPKAS